MPSLLPSGALLALCDPANWTTSDVATLAEDSDDESNNIVNHVIDKVTVFPPWSWATWQECTGIATNIFSSEPHAHTPELWNTPDHCAAVWAFVKAYWALSDSERVEYIHRSKKDCNSKGRNLYLDWFKSQSSKWKLSLKIASALSERGVDPYSHLKTCAIERVSVIFYFLVLMMNRILISYDGGTEI